MIIINRDKTKYFSNGEHVEHGAILRVTEGAAIRWHASGDAYNIAFKSET